jgi:hypothetical protein
VARAGWFACWLRPGGDRRVGLRSVGSAGSARWPGSPRWVGFAVAVQSAACPVGVGDFWGRRVVDVEENHAMRPIA